MSHPLPSKSTLARAALFLSVATVPSVLGAQAVPVWAAALDSAVQSELSRTRTPGVQVAVVVDGQVAYSKGYGVADVETGRAVTDRTLFRVGSVTKMFAAATLTQLAADKKLDLDLPIGTYVTELAGKKVGAVTTHQLLTHSAGWLDNAVAYGRMGEGALGEVMREVTDTLFITEPGRVISYSNPGYSMAGFVAERAGQARFATLTEQLVLRNVGMTRATFRPLEVMTQDFSQGHVGPPTGAGTVVRPYTENTAQWAAGFLFSSAGEIGRFAAMLMNGGTIDGKRVLAEQAVRRMTTGHQAIPGSATARYGYGLRVETVDGQRIWQHGGSINGFDAQVTMFPDRKLAVVVLDNRAGAPLRGIVDLVAQRAAGITPATPAPLPAERTANAEERAALVGTYRHGGLVVTLLEKDGALFVEQRGSTAPVTLQGDERIVITPPAGDKQVILVVRDANGRAAYLHQGLRAIVRQP